MERPVPAHPRSREQALAAGDWEGARAAFEAALEDGAGPEVHEGFGHALWWLQDVDGAIQQMERAYAGFRERGDAARPAWIALWLSREYAAVHGNVPAANGWYARAEGLLRDADPEPLPRCSTQPAWSETLRQPGGSFASSHGPTMLLGSIGGATSQ